MHVNVTHEQIYIVIKGMSYDNQLELVSYLCKALSASSLLALSARVRIETAPRVERGEM